METWSQRPQLCHTGHSIGGSLFPLSIQSPPAEKGVRKRRRGPTQDLVSKEVCHHWRGMRAECYFVIADTTSGVSCRREMGWNGTIILIYMMYIQRLGRPFDPRTTKALNGWRPRRRRRSESYSSHHIISTIVEWRSHQKGFNYRHRNLGRLLPLSKTFFTIRDKNGQNRDRNTGKKRIRKQCQDQEKDFF